MNPKAVNTVAIQEDPLYYSIRCGNENDRFAQILSSVMSHSVLLLGVAPDLHRRCAGTELPYSVIAVIPLAASVDPDQTVATLDGNDLLLRLAKSPVALNPTALLPIRNRALFDGTVSW